jgi:hypothetical protein
MCFVDIVEIEVGKAGGFIFMVAFTVVISGWLMLGED